MLFQCLRPKLLPHIKPLNRKQTALNYENKPTDSHRVLVDWFAQKGKWQTKAERRSPRHITRLAEVVKLK